MATPATEYAHWYATWDKQLRDLLRQTESDITRRLRTAEGMRGSQLRNSKAAVRAALRDMNGEMYTLLKAGRLDAAALAGRLVAEMQAGLLSEVMTSGQLDAYIRGEAARAASALDNAMIRMRGDSYKALSAQVYQTGALSQGLVDARINSMIAQGASARDIAAAVRGLVNPDVPGGVSFASMRLGRTELNNAFHASAKDRMRRSPFVEAVVWETSGSHPRPDICDEYAERDNDNLGPGRYMPDNVPEKPHPQCMCYITADLISDEEFINRATRGDYDNYASGEAPELGQPFRDLASANPEVRRKVDNLTPEQRAKWMTDHRPVAKKMADPKYATPGDTGTFVPKPPVPKPPAPTVISKPNILSPTTTSTAPKPMPKKTTAGQPPSRQAIIDTNGVKVSPDKVRKVEDTLNDLDRQYPGAYRNSDLIITNNKASRSIGNAYADFSPRSHTIRVNTHLFTGGRNAEFKREWNFQSQWFTRSDPTDTIKSTVTHEFGHHLDYSLSATQRKTMFENIADTLGLERPRWQSGYTDVWTARADADAWVAANKAAISVRVGKYASSNSRELIAELFAEGQAPGPSSVYAKWEANGRVWEPSGRSASRYVVEFMRGAFG